MTSEIRSTQRGRRFANTPRYDGFHEARMSMTGAVVDSVSDLYCFRDRNKVSAYLGLHREILPVLVEAYSHIQAQFGSGAPAVLSVISEPANPQSAELFVLISTSLPVGQALAAMRRFDEEWWLEVPEYHTGTLNFDVEFA